jgi:hypothetical protein
MGIQWHIKNFMAKSAIRLLKSTGWYTGYWNHWRGEMFDHSEKNGLHILPVHYYSPIPLVSQFCDSYWAGERPDPTGISLQTEKGLELLGQLAASYRPEYEAFPRDQGVDPHGFFLENPAYSVGDAEILYSLIRDLKPRRMIEVGSGYSTLVASSAIRRNLKDDPCATCEFTCLEPYPPSYLSPLPDGVSRMIPLPVQRTPLETFAALEPGDILFIDSSHVVALGSDVVFIYTEILPRLAPGVVVHIHDIFLPHDYPSDWLRRGRFFWNEQYLLQAFLLFNRAFEVVLPTHAVARRHPEEFGRAIPSYRDPNSSPSSFWLRKL